MTQESTIVAERQRFSAQFSLREIVPFMSTGGPNSDDTDPILLEQRLLGLSDERGHALPLADEVLSPAQGRRSFSPRHAVAVGGLTFVGLLAPGLVAPQRVDAQRPRLGPPQITVRQVRGMVYLMAQADCRQRLKDTIKQNPGVDIRSGKCTVPERFIRNCRVGPLGKQDANPPLRQNEGFCTAAYHMHLKDLTTPEIPGIVTSDINAVCSSYRQGVRLIPVFFRGRDGRAQVKWITDPDPTPGKTVKFICRKV